MLFFKTPNIDFIGKRYISFTLSLILIAISIFAIVVKGPNYGIDFSGGILIQASFEKDIDMNSIRTALTESTVGSFELQSTGKNGVIIRVKKTEKSQDELAKDILSILQGKIKTNNITIDRTEYVGPAVGKHLTKQALYAFTFVFIGIIIYVAFRFKSALWGISGVIGLIHDIFITFGLLVLMGKEIDLTIISALLTIAGYSINDTIVLFDRIRENLRLLSKETFGNIINKSINEVLSRTVITSLTVFFVAIIILFMGGIVIHDFAFAMFIGTFIGVYSSVFICAPLTYEWEKRKRDRFKKNATIKK